MYNILCFSNLHRDPQSLLLYYFYNKCIIIQVGDMVKNIRTAFYSMVKSVDWIDSPTETATLEKVQYVNATIGFPDWILDTNELEDYYDGINEVKIFLQ